jgi:hypothetical protein
LFQELCRVNQETNDPGQAHIDALEAQVRQLQSEVERLRQVREPEQWLWGKILSRLMPLKRT